MRVPIIGAIVALALTIAFTAPAAAAEPFVVEDIEIRSENRISEGTILNYLPVRTGEEFGEEDAARAIRALYDTGLFKDVSIARSGNTLVVTVQERPAIGEINLEGDYSMKEEQLRNSLAQIGLAPGRIFRRAQLEQVKQELRRLVYSQGKYGVELETSVRQLSRNRVAIDITLNEGKVARIRQIKLLGNEAFDDETLKEKMESGIPPAWAFLSSADEYSRAKLEGDQEAIRSYYLNRGYLRFSITSTQVTITPDKKDIYITINMEEGDQYTVDGISVSGDLPVPREALRKRVKLDKGELFSREALTASRTAISDRLARAGYAFASVNAVPQVDEENKTVDIRFYVDPGNRVYVRRVTFSGFTQTEDRVFRRELRQMEGGLYSPSALQRSKVRLQRLDGVEKVRMETERVPGEPGMVDVNYDITERETGSLRLGAGFSSGTGIGLNVEVSEKNLLGTGNDLKIAFDTTEVNRQIELRYTDPFYTKWGVSRSLRLVFRESDPNNITDTTDFFSDEGTVGFTFGVPLSEFNTLTYGLGIDYTGIRTTDSTPTPIIDFLDRRGEDFLAGTGSISWTRDSRNRRIFADSGMRQSVSLDLALPGSDVEYYKLNYSIDHFLPLNETFVLSTSARIGLGRGYGQDEDLPFFRRFFAGGIRSVRGYERGSLGPRYTQAEAGDRDPKGGDLVTTGSIELTFPPPFVTQSGQTRLSTFFDFGNVYAEPADFDSSSLRASAGVAFNWRSPVGPLSISLAQPINDQPRDDTQQVQFTIGTLF